MSFDVPKVARHWDTWQTSKAAQASAYSDWADHPTIFRAVMKHSFGDENGSFFEFLRQHYPECAQAHALSLCCGDASFEIQLLEQGIFRCITGVDISTSRLEAARHQVLQRPCRLLTGQWPLRLECLDVNQGQYGKACYDVVFAKAALHHLIDLDAAFQGISACLKPGGLLIAIDFFGPSRFQWTDTQLKAANLFWSQCVPPALSRNADGTDLEPLDRPSIESMMNLDPSEAARSGELWAYIKQYFEIEQRIDLGGTLLNLILWGDRVNRFDANDPLHNQILLAATQWERDLIRNGLLPSDFCFTVARKKA